LKLFDFTDLTSVSGQSFDEKFKTVPLYAYTQGKEQIRWLMDITRKYFK